MLEHVISVLSPISIFWEVISKKPSKMPSALNAALVSGKTCPPFLFEFWIIGVSATGNKCSFFAHMDINRNSLAASIIQIKLGG